MVSRGLSACLVAAALFAGCAGPAPSDPGADNGAGGGSGAPADGNFPGPIGSSNGPAPGASATNGASNGTSPAPPRLAVTPLSYEGTTGGTVCVFAQPDTGNCMAVTPDDHGLTPLDVPGVPLRLAANVTWTAASPATTTLRAFLVYQADGTDWRWTDQDPYIDGPSPLVIDWDLGPYANMTLALVVNAFQGQGAGGASAGADTPQDFSVEGAVTSRLA
jgi:hypothetical protein